MMKWKKYQYSKNIALLASEMLGKDKSGQSRNWELEDLISCNLPPMERHIRIDDEVDEAYDDYESEKGLKKYARIILPHIGLVIITVAYVVIGASIFYMIENPHEHRIKILSLRRIREEKTAYLQLLWNYTQSPDQGSVSPQEFVELGLSQMSNLTDLIHDSIITQFITSKEIRENSTQVIWSFTSAIFFAVTVVTTIGYGNPVPHSLSGKVLTVVFAMFGVPLTLITIADLGKFLSEHLIWLYSKWVTLKYRIRQYLRGGEANVCSDENDDICEYCKYQNSLLEVQQERKIPAMLLMCILIGYTALGGCLLSHLESWPFFNAFYFSFITMTTIGFGDYVPTKNDNIYIALLYMILGLAITTMCIDLVGVQYIRKIHYFGRRIQSAQQVLAIVGGKAIYLSDLLGRSRFGSKRYRDKMDALIIENLLLTGRLAFTPRDIKRIRYIDEGTDSIPSCTASITTASCQLCHSRNSLHRCSHSHIESIDRTPDHDESVSYRQTQTV